MEQFKPWLNVLLVINCSLKKSRLFYEMRNTTRSDKVDTNSSTEDSIEATTIIAVTIADREK